MTKGYLDSVVKEVQGMLADWGRVTFNETAEYFDLPSNFLKDLMSSNLREDESMDAEGINTWDYLNREMCRVRGILWGITRPVAYVTLSNKYKINVAVLMKHIEALADRKEIHYKSSSGIYVPDCYSKI